ncbi:MAG TPA: restriction endonuclease subunit S [Terracidiphilus sp.]|nr:restriction endonuclease subunit S [Terracidiphilus sp.]HWB12779.1 restriction endonuclease subunit S [Pirellulales bacterium]
MMTVSAPFAADGIGIPQLPNNWTLPELRDISHRVMVGIASAATHAYRERGIPMFRNKDIGEGILRDDDLLFLDEAYEHAHRRKRLQPGDILTVRTGNPGVSAVVPPEFANAQCFTSLITRPNSQLVDSWYLCEFINSVHGMRQINVAQAGAAQKNVNAQRLQRIQVPLPPLSEQRAIVEVAATWTSVIQQLSEVIAAKLRFKQGLMQQLLSGKRRFCAFAGRSLIPQELATFLTPVTRPTQRPTHAYTALGLRSHGKGTFFRHVEDPTQVQMEELYHVVADDLIVNITFAWEGAIAIASTEDERALVSHRFPTFVIDRSKALPEFLRQIVITPWFVFKMGLVSPGGAGRNRVLNKKDFLKIAIPLPHLDEQEKIAGLLGSCDRELDLLRRQLNALRMQKKGLMQKLLTGQVRVKP